MKSLMTNTHNHNPSPVMALLTRRAQTLKNMALKNMALQKAGPCRLEKPYLPHDQTRAGFIMDLVALATGVPSQHIRSETRCNARAARARQIAMYLAYVAYGWPLARIGQAFGRDRTTAGYACRLVEDLRDDRQFDAKLDRLEACLRNAPDPLDIKLLGTDLLEMAS